MWNLSTDWDHLFLCLHCCFQAICSGFIDAKIALFSLDYQNLHIKFVIGWYFGVMKLTCWISSIPSKIVQSSVSLISSIVLRVLTCWPVSLFITVILKYSSGKFKITENIISIVNSNTYLSEMDSSSNTIFKYLGFNCNI